MKGFLTFLISKAGKLVLTIILAVIIWAVGILLLTSTDVNTSPAPMIIFFLVCGIFGLGFLNSVLPEFSIVLPWEAAVALWIFKISVGIVIGIFVAPFQISRYIIGFIEEAISNK